MLMGLLLHRMGRLVEQICLFIYLVKLPNLDFCTEEIQPHHLIRIHVLVFCEPMDEMTNRVLGKPILELVTKPVTANFKARTFNFDPYSADCRNVLKGHM